MGIQTTSRLAFYEVLPTLNARQKRVMEVLAGHAPLTNTELASRLGWAINTVTPRVNELVKKKLVRLHERRYCTVTGRMAIAWEVVETPSF